MSSSNVQDPRPAGVPDENTTVPASRVRPDRYGTKSTRPTGKLLVIGIVGMLVVLIGFRRERKNPVDDASSPNADDDD